MIATTAIWPGRSVQDLFVGYLRRRRGNRKRILKIFYLMLLNVSILIFRPELFQMFYIVPV